MNKTSYRQKARIILAIAAKDSLDALKNRTILALIFGILGLMLSAKAMPLLLAMRDRPILAVYAPAGFPSLQTLEARQDMEFVRFDSEQEMKSLLVDTQNLVFGLVIPADVEKVSSNGQLFLDGYYPNWASPTQVRKRVAFFESVLSNASGTVIRIKVDGHEIYPTVEPAKHLMMATQSSTVMILLMGLMLAPYLFLEEKEQHTLDALLVSPANYSQLVTGKALAGVVYCLLATVVVILFNFRLIVHWEYAMLALILGSAFAVLTGLLLGILLENQTSLGMWMGLLLVIFAGPSVILSFGNTKIPSAVADILTWTPGAAFNDLLKISMYEPVSLMQIVKDAAILVFGILVIYALVVWRVRQMDR